MNIRRNDSGEFRNLWDEARNASRSVAEWPAWKRGEIESASSRSGDSRSTETRSQGDTAPPSAGHGPQRT